MARVSWNNASIQLLSPEINAHEPVVLSRKDVSNCCARGCSPKEDAKRYLGDWLLIGLSLLTMLSISSMKRNS